MVMNEENKNDWKTTTAGILAGVGILLTQASYVIDADPNTSMSIEAILMALGLIGIGWLAKGVGKK